jgi:hypothetical protein
MIPRGAYFGQDNRSSLPKISTMTGASLNEVFWQTVVSACGSFKIEASCQLFLRAWISNGIQRMEDEHRMKPEDVETANSNLKTFVEMMTSEALRTNATKLDSKAFRAAEHALERRSMVSIFSLWPFWPHAFGG